MKAQLLAGSAKYGTTGLRSASLWPSRPPSPRLRWAWPEPTPSSTGRVLIRGPSGRAPAGGIGRFGSVTRPGPPTALYKLMETAAVIGLSIHAAGDVLGRVDGNPRLAQGHPVRCGRCSWQGGDGKR